MFPCVGVPCDLRCSFTFRKYFFPLSLRLLHLCLPVRLSSVRGWFLQKTTLHAHTARCCAPPVRPPCTHMHVPRWCFSHRSSPACAVPADNFWFSREYQQLSAFPDDLHPTRPPPILAANTIANSVCHWNQLSDDDCLGWIRVFPLHLNHVFPVHRVVSCLFPPGL